MLSNGFNALNQNTTSRWSGALTVLGIVNLTNGNVSVNGVPASILKNAAPSPMFAATNLPVVAGTNTYTAIHTDPFGRAATSAVSVIARDRGYGYDANGNLTNDGQFVYVWDNADRLKEVRTLDNSLVMSCRYDGLGRRRERIVAAGHEGGPSTNRYVYDDWRVLEVRDGTNGVIESYTHGPDLSGTIGGAGGIGGILSVATGGTTSVSSFLYDGNGNVVRLTDTNRAIVSALEYGPFGTVLVKSGSYTPRYQFSSKEFDAAVGLSYYGLRYYASKCGRWLQRDPLGLVAGINPFEFCYNDPNVWYDDLGGDPNCGGDVTRRNARRAGKAAGERGLADSRSGSGGEYCGLLCQRPDCSVYATRTEGKTKRSCVPSLAPCESGDKRVGTWHNHPPDGGKGFSWDMRTGEGDLGAHRAGEIDTLTNPDGTTYEMTSSPQEPPEFVDITDEENPRKLSFDEAVNFR